VLALPQPVLARPPVRGQALGAQVTLHLDHPEAERLGAMALHELSRLERIFSLYQPASALSVLNKTGVLEAPPPELLDCLATCGAVHRASGGRFDPTVQPLWATLAEAHAAGQSPDPARIEAARAQIGWDRIGIGSAAIFLAPGQAMTLNGVAQGYVTDRVAALLRREGLEVGLIDAGEIAVIGAEWPVRLENGPRLTLTDRALATSGTFGTVMDKAGRQGHILSPRAEAAVWQMVSVTAPRAVLADALSTAGCLMPDKAALDALIAAFPGCRVEQAVPL